MTMRTPILKKLVPCAAGFAALAIFAGSSLSLEAAAAQESRAGLFTLIPASGADLKDLSLALKHPALRSHKPLFSQSERNALKAMGESSLAAASEVRFANESDYREFAAHVIALRLKLKLEPVEIPVTLTSREPLENEQWGLHNEGSALTIPVDDITSATLPARKGEDIGLKTAPAEKTDSAPVIVAVLDTGIDAAHPDLAPAILRKDAECEALEKYRECLKGTDKKACDQKWAAFDSDGNGYPMDCAGWNLTVGKNPLNGIQGNSQTSDTVGHGTHVAGVIGAALDNGLGIRGVTAKAALLPVKIFNANPRSPVRAQSLGSEPLPEPSENGKTWDTGFADIIARGVLYAVRSGARVMNISLAWPASADSELMRRMVQLAQDRGVLIVAAAGNDSTEAEVMPCAYPGVVCVASHQPDGSLSHFSNHGASVDIAAPGVRILSTWPLSLRPAVFTDLLGYEFKNGTSMAAPFVTGALARLLAFGYSGEEAYARLLAGARVQNSDTSGALGGERRVRFGNLDLGASHALSPEPLILPTRKESIELSWDRVSERLSASVELRNVWADAGSVEIGVRVQPGLTGSLDIPLSRLFFSDWKKGTKRMLQIPIRILRDDFPSDLDLWLDIRSAGAAPRSIKVKLSVSVPVTGVRPVTAAGTDPEMNIVALNDSPASGEQTRVRTVIPTGTSASSAAHQDYALITRGVKGDRRLRLVSRKLDDGVESGPYEDQGTYSLSASEGELLAIYRLDWDGQGEDEYAVLTTIASSPGKSDSKFRFLFLGRTDSTSSGLTLLHDLTYQPTKAVIPEGFSWLRTKNGLYPAWVGGGFTPESETPAYDPWNPDWADSPLSHFYYIDRDGLHTVSAPDSYIFVSALGQTEAQKRVGAVPVLLAKGDSYRLEYASGLIHLKTKPELAELTPLKLPRFRMLLGYESAFPVWTVENGAESAGNAFSLSGRPGTLRTTLLEYGPASGSQSTPAFGRVRDILSTAAFEADSVVRTAAVFGGRNGGIFTQTQFDLQFQDLGEGYSGGKAVLSSLRRFSFLPQLSFLRGFIPAVVHSRDTAGPRRPAILIEGSPTGKDYSETIFPEYSPDGSLERLAQPARLRLAAGPGCQRIPNPISPDAQRPSQVAFFCGDRFVFVPLTR